jgi:diguanylate cyclase
VATESEDWRKKYYESLRSLEGEERQFRAQERVLRGLVTRLCLAAQGQSPRLDTQLQRLKDAVRGDVRGDALEPMGQAIADAVLELDHGTATLTALKILTGDEVQGEGRVRSVLARLLTELRQDPQLAKGAEAVERELAVALTREHLPQVVERVGGLVVQRIQGLQKTRQELELLLGQMLAQLDALTRYVADENQHHTERSASNAALNTQVAGEVQALGESVESGTDLALIRRQLRQRLDSIGRHLHDFRNREEERTRQARVRTEQMRGRMDEMESEARKLHARLLDEKRLSMLDPLTQIPNRLAYDQHIAEELDRWRRFTQPTCVAAWDIDRFKNINDSYGHRAGDKVLSVVAECLARGIRSTDFVARYGGEEFVMILPGTTLEVAMRLLEQMRAEVSRLGFHFRGEPVSVTMSCGATALHAGDEPEDVFDRADKALYQAKDAGRNRVVSA